MRTSNCIRAWKHVYPILIWFQILVSNEVLHAFYVSDPHRVGKKKVD